MQNRFGQFIVPTCESMRLDIRVILRNTLRDDQTSPSPAQAEGLRVDLRVFERGAMILHRPEFGSVPFGGYLEVSTASCPGLLSPGQDRLIVARCWLSDGSFAPQEHQIVYQKRNTGIVSSLLYDQIPLLQSGRKPPPIVLLAPKAWVSRTVNTYVVFGNSSSNTVPTVQPEPMSIFVLSGDGRVIAHQTRELLENDTLTFDVRAAIGEVVEFTDAPAFFTVVARGGASSFIVVTFVHNEETGNFALEHSLSPHYYVTGDLGRVRREAVCFPPAIYER